MNGAEGPLSVSLLRAHADSVRVAADKRWILWVYQDIMLWKMVGHWPTPVARAHIQEIWEVFLSLRQRFQKVYVVIDTDDFASQSYEFRDLLVTEWSHILDREDLVICLAASDPMRRALRNTMAMLAGRLEQFRFLKSLEAALRYIDHHRRSGGAAAAPADLGIADVVDQLARAHERLAAAHDQDLLESETVGEFEHRFQELFLGYPTAVFYLDLWGRFAWGNRRAEEILGHSMDDLVGRPYFESRLATFESLVRASGLLSEQPPKQPCERLELEVVRRDGSPATLEVTGQLVSFGPKKVILCMAADTASREGKGRSGMDRRKLTKVGVICPRCHKIQDRTGRWHSPELFHRIYHHLRFQRILCPECSQEASPNLEDPGGVEGTDD